MGFASCNIQFYHLLEYCVQQQHAVALGPSCMLQLAADLSVGGSPYVLRFYYAFHIIFCMDSIHKRTLKSLCTTPLGAMAPQLGISAPKWGAMAPLNAEPQRAMPWNRAARHRMANGQQQLEAS